MSILKPWIESDNLENSLDSFTIATPRRAPTPARDAIPSTAHRAFSRSIVEPPSRVTTIQQTTACDIVHADVLSLDLLQAGRLFWEPPRFAPICDGRAGHGVKVRKVHQAFPQLKHRTSGVTLAVLFKRKASTVEPQWVHWNANRTGEKDCKTRQVLLYPPSSWNQNLQGLEDGDPRPHIDTEAICNPV